MTKRLTILLLGTVLALSAVAYSTACSTQSVFGRVVGPQVPKDELQTHILVELDSGPTVDVASCVALPVPIGYRAEVQERTTWLFGAKRYALVGYIDHRLF